MAVPRGFVAFGVAAAAMLAVALATPRPPAIAQPSDCDPARPHTPGDSTETIDTSDGWQRRYVLHVPPGYDGAAALPLVLNLHGHSDDGARQAALSALPAKADAEGFLLVMPDGTAATFDPDRHWNHIITLERSLDPDSADDIVFFSELLDELEAELCIDAARIFVTGFSNGAFMTSRLACSLTDRIAAVAPVAGAYYPPWSPDLTIEPPCSSMRAVPVVAFHGTADSRVPFEGGLFPPAFIFHLRHVEEEVMPDWAAHNRCTAEPVHEQVSEHARLVRYEDCEQNATVELYVIEGGEHQWPGADDVPAPDISDEISANDLMWEFFHAHPLVAPLPAEPAEPTPAALPRTGADGDGGGDTTWLIAGAASGLLALTATAWWARRRGIHS